MTTNAVKKARLRSREIDKLRQAKKALEAFMAPDGGNGRVAEGYRASSERQRIYLDSWVLSRLDEVLEWIENGTPEWIPRG